jgi:hypothetical protein
MLVAHAISSAAFAWRIRPVAYGASSIPRLFFGIQRANCQARGTKFFAAATPIVSLAETVSKTTEDSSAYALTNPLSIK